MAATGHVLDGGALIDARNAARAGYGQAIGVLGVPPASEPSPTDLIELPGLPSLEDALGHVPQHR